MENYYKNNNESAKDYAYRVLKTEIMSTRLKPGQLLSEADLANKLNISRTPVRDALMRLRTEHLIEVKPQYGSYVTLIDISLIEQAIFMRSSLEKEALLLATKEFSEQILYEIDKNIFSQKLLLSSYQDELEFHLLDQEFHKFIFEGINKSLIWGAIQNISSHYNRMRVLVDTVNDKSHLIEEHEEYLRIIKEKDISAIDEIIHRHIIAPTKHWEDYIEKNPEIKSLLIIK